MLLIKRSTFCTCREMRMNSRSSKTIVVNGISLDFAAGILRDSQGKDVVLRSQAFAVLEYLSRHADRVVTKDELMQACVQRSIAENVPESGGWEGIGGL
ncbi:MAG: hypothetical protein E5W81_21140 [Mesorhizobium sp.]|nr:MAG: hypothetical protein E5V36_04320 [Mesorhizobium sp.]TKB60009.1 MAG: hypothetical protein E5W81_21140 [Mesorhizobium sp.]